ncbi:Uncharacterised protein [[Clostridium] sordellii]|uniref:hypothetical protein n=1 Tax=Paraclostridium sordellii TaxID=1505 RepID=UPI0005DA7E0B|nr:hypothetical protein [Paeniclostridium sordellii]CEO04863.1 Uncharacterised protein [[Clostridium] sordellii] [Paeniclostridium sordellii]
MEDFVLNLINFFTKNIEVRHLVFLIIGIFLGVLINNKTSLIRSLKKNPIEIIMGFFIFIIVMSQFTSTSKIKEYSFDLLNFTCNVAFAWMMTKYSVKNDYESKQKEIASMAYSYSLKCENNIDYGMKICDMAEKELSKNDCGKGNCKLSNYLSRVKDTLISSKNDASQNTLNWSLKISTEINSMQKMDNLASEIQHLESDLQTIDPDSLDYQKLKRKISKKQKEIKNINQTISPEIKSAIESVHSAKNDNIRIIEKSIEQETAKHFYEGLKDKASKLKPREDNTSSEGTA